MHSIVGASVSSDAMDAQARAAWLVWRGWCGLNNVEYVIIRYHTKYNNCTCMYKNMSLLSTFAFWIYQSEPQDGPRGGCTRPSHSPCFAWLRARVRPTTVCAYMYNHTQ